MGVAGHLHIELDEYDDRIRTFVPHYEHMIGVVADALRLVETAQPIVVDLGIGTGALAQACLRSRPDAKLIGIDADAGMLEAARSRLKALPGVELIRASFLEHALPPADAFVACISLHHIRDPAAKRALYARVYERLPDGGVFVSADCFPAIQPALAAGHREAWLAHLERTYTRAEAEAHLESWSDEDVYVPLEVESAWLRDAGFLPEVLWRDAGFAVIAAFRTARPTGA